MGRTLFTVSLTPQDRGFTLCSLLHALCFFVASRPGGPDFELVSLGFVAMRYAPCSLLFVSFVASRPTGPILQPQGQEGRSLSAAVRLCYALCALRFFAVTDTEHGYGARSRS